MKSTARNDQAVLFLCFLWPHYGHILCTKTHHNAPYLTIAKKLKVLENAGKISIFKDFCFGRGRRTRTSKKSLFIACFRIYGNNWPQKTIFLSGGEKIFKEIACGAYSVFSDLGVYVERGADILVTEDGL